MREYGKETRDPSSHRTPSQIARMDHTYNSTPLHIRWREERNQARAIMAKKVGKEALKGKDVDHKRMVKDGGGNSPSNLRIQTEHKNRGWRRDT